MADLYKGIAGSPITYLSSDISAGQTTINVSDGTVLPDAPNICTIGYGEEVETIKYNTKVGGTLSDVTRGIEGTPREWQKGTEVARFFTTYDHNAIIENFTSHLADNMLDKEVHGIKMADYIMGKNINDNGHIRFESGLQLAWTRLTAQGNLGEWINGLYYRDFNMPQWTAPFLEKPLAFGGIDSLHFWTTLGNVTNTSSGIIRIIRPVNVTDVTTIYVWAIGRWK